MASKQRTDEFKAEAARVYLLGIRVLISKADRALKDDDNVLIDIDGLKRLSR